MSTHLYVYYVLVCIRNINGLPDLPRCRADPLTAGAKALALQGYYLSVRLWPGRGLRDGRCFSFPTQE